MSELVNKDLIERNRLSDWEDLSPEQRAFVFEYMQNGFNHREAAREAGFKPDNGFRMLRHPLVASYIQHLQEEQYERSLLTKSFVEAQYLEIIPKLKGEENIPLVTGMGEEVLVKKFHSAEIVSVLRDLSKISGMQTEEKQNKNAVSVTINYGAMVGDSPEPTIIEGEIEDV